MFCAEAFVARLTDSRVSEYKWLKQYCMMLYRGSGRRKLRENG